MQPNLSDLSDAIRPKIEAFLSALNARGVLVKWTSILRTHEEQAENILKGVSWTTHSRHLPDADGKSNAIDICPIDRYALSSKHGEVCRDYAVNWDASHPVWELLGTIGESCGLKWGGRWKEKDMGHFEI